MQEVLTFFDVTTYFFEPSKLFACCMSEYYGSIIIFLVWLLTADCSTRCDFVSKISKSSIALLISIHRPYMCILQKNDEVWFLTLYEETWSYECHFILGIKSSTVISTLFQITVYRVICTLWVTQVKNCLFKTFIWMCIRIKRDTR